MKTLLALSLLLVIGCSAPQMTMFQPKQSAERWNIQANRTMIGKITVTINDSTVITETPGLFSYSFEAKGMYRNHEIKVLANYNQGFLGIGSGWETIIFVDNEMAAKFKL
jgi:hypothetical protein